MIWPFTRIRDLEDIARSQRDQIDRLNRELDLERGKPTFIEVAKPLAPKVASAIQEQAQELVVEQLADILRPHVVEELRRAFRTMDRVPDSPLLYAAMAHETMAIRARIVLPKLSHEFAVAMARRDRS